MYAVIRSGGKQHRVQQGESLKLEKLELETGATIEFDEVLMVGEGDQVHIGTPHVEGGKVSAEVVSHGRGDKIKIIKFKRRKHHMKQMGHRQWYTEVRITDIAASGGKSKTKKAEAKKAEEPKAAPVSGTAAADDLTKISGVGPVLVGKLNDAGITTFTQIAEFTAEDIERLDGELNFKGRIERDDWITQAKKFLEEG